MSSPEVKDADEHKRPPNVMQCIVVRPSLRLREIIDTASLPIARQNFLPRKPPQLLVTGLCRAGQILALASYVGEVRCLTSSSLSVAQERRWAIRVLVKELRLTNALAMLMREPGSNAFSLVFAPFLTPCIPSSISH